MAGGAGEWRWRSLLMKWIVSGRAFDCGIGEGVGRGSNVLY